MAFLILLYVLMAIFMGWLGRDKAIGFVGFFLLSLAITPLSVAVILLITSLRSDRVS